MACPPPSSRRRTLLLSLCGLSLLAALSSAHAAVPSSTSASTSTPIRDVDILACDAVRVLSAVKDEVEEGASPLMRQVFAYLFPFGPAWNSVLGTFYISSIPNFILAFIPAQINRDTLNTMTAFATGGLLSDVFLHLVPHAFVGESAGHGVRFVMVEEKRNILVGLGIFVGFAAFFVMEKTLRVLGGEDAHSHSHGHDHSHSRSPSHDHTDDAHAHSSALEEKSDGLRARSVQMNGGAASSTNGDVGHGGDAGKGPSRLSAYLNLFGDFVHNITDGLAMAASFYSSPLIGATTTLACFAHEIPHEIADYSILVRSGFSKREAMRSQFVTAVGAFVGTFAGIGVHSLAGTGGAGGGEAGEDLVAAIRRSAGGLLGTTVQAADLVIPFVAGGFLYIGAVAVLPTLLEESKSGKQALREFGAMAFGVVCMFLVAWNE